MSRLKAGDRQMRHFLSFMRTKTTTFRLDRICPVAIALFLVLAPGPTQAADTSPSPLLAQLAQAYAQGDSDRLSLLSEQVVEQTPEDLALSPPEYATLALHLADALHDEGKLRKAIILYQRCIAVLEKNEGKDAAALLQPLDALAKVEAEVGDNTKAIAIQERALAIAQLRRGVSDPGLSGRYDALISAQRTAKVGLASVPELEAARDLIVHPEQREPKTLGPYQETNTTHQLVKVFYATDRNQTGSKDWSNFYGHDRADLTFGTAQVSVPKRRDVGSLPTTGWYEYVFRIAPDPAKNLILESIDPAPRARFFDGLKQTVAKSTLKEELIFIHGFNTSFEDGLYRAATLAVDLNINGASILYSWPSDGSVMGYVMDRDELTMKAKKDLAAFIYDVATKTGAQKVHVIAHSMGNAYLLSALEQLQLDHPGARGIIDELIFASPDVDAEDFSDRAPAVAALAHRTTLYSSSADEALRLSQMVQGHARAGNHQPPLFVQNLQTIDTTKAQGSFDFIGHSDFAGPALDDFRSIVWLSLAAPKHCILSQAQGAGGIVWVFGTPHCDADVFQRAILFMRSRNGDLSAAIADLRRSIAAAARPDEKQKLWAVLSVVQTLR